MGRVISHALKGSSEQHWTHFCYWATEQISAMEQRNTFLLMSNGTHFWNWATEHISAIEQHWTYYCKLSSDEQEHITSNLSYFMLHAIVAYVLVWIEEISPFWLLIALERERDTHTCAACFSDITTPVFAGSIKLLYNLTFKVICLHHNIIHFMFATSICNPSVSKLLLALVSKIVAYVATWQENWNMKRK